MQFVEIHVDVYFFTPVVMLHLKGVNDVIYYFTCLIS